MKTKFIAFYLPQYHTIPENDLWWGKGFTEWVRVKASKPLFKKHDQPRVPYEYYDLSDIRVMKDQSRLAKEYGIYGFCYYHYWFNGKLLLEKPLEQMLTNKEVDIPYCLCWANEPWTRAWDGNSKKILMPQEYGDKTAWIEHIKYLEPFFKDERYIKIDGKPLLLIYRTESFQQFDEMIKIWSEYLKNSGHNGIHIAEMLTSYQHQPLCSLSNAVVEFEPMLTVNTSRTFITYIKNILLLKAPWLLIKKYRTKDYDKIWHKILIRNSIYNNKAVYLGAFTDWDNTPRLKNKSLIFQNSSPQKFENYLLKQAMRTNSEFIFINAWNEWAEGVYLEPDLKNKFAFLEAVRNVYSKLSFDYSNNQ